MKNRTFACSENEMTAPLASWPIFVALGWVGIFPPFFFFLWKAGEIESRLPLAGSLIVFGGLVALWLCVRRSYLRVDARGIEEEYVYFRRFTPWVEVRNVKLVNDGDGATIGVRLVHGKTSLYLKLISAGVDVHIGGPFKGASVQRVYQEVKRLHHEYGKDTP